ncbi:hypothetical protein [Pseudanabaena sp. ABRG5-3]|uniref:hypothetical protein n=1 Tax=Pseudanabaena sp. ABRG5-3 TaxID=685565 RepID=UPI000DC6D887|nr:hypothetical protein [Pseudanabaena sp. ABRG5-3]BBC24689.1 hypothetical protein ABRG53_2432 [Pseudanabaena sp. ABRG5-3]
MKPKSLWHTRSVRHRLLVWFLLDTEYKIPKGDGDLNYSNPKWFVEAHPEGVRFHKPKNLQMI